MIHGIQCNAVWRGRRAGKLNENDEDDERGGSENLTIKQAGWLGNKLAELPHT